MTGFRSRRLLFGFPVNYRYYFKTAHAVDARRKHIHTYMDFVELPFIDTATPEAGPRCFELAIQIYQDTNNGSAQNTIF